MLINILVRFYGIFKKLGFLENKFSARIFERCYFIYKRNLEDPFHGLSKKHASLFLNGHIFDIGANIGYTASVFYKALMPGFKVFAFEPDIENFSRLSSFIEGSKLNSAVEAHRIAMGKGTSTGHLLINRKHHGDHRITSNTETTDPDKAIVSVPITSVDAWIADHAIKEPISFIKIDVQGYESEVCKGLLNTLKNNPDMSIALEYAPEEMKELGFSSEQIFSLFSDDLKIYRIKKNGDLTPLSSIEELDILSKTKKYTDILMTRKNISL